MIYIPDSVIDGLIQEDFQYGDLTVDSLGISDHEGVIKFKSREEGIVCCTEEVARILSRLGADVDFYASSGTKVERDSLLVEAHGKAGSLHAGWKTCANMLEYFSSVSTATWEMAAIMKKVRSGAVLAATRKMIPGTRLLSIKAVLCAGGKMHRNGLSESILIFKQHAAFADKGSMLEERISKAKKNIPEKKIIIEIEDIAKIDSILNYEIDGIQFDKCYPEDIKPAVASIKSSKPHAVTIAAGGINIKNIDKYAVCGVDIIATSSMYHCPPFDVGVTICPAF
jgi:molybdenum transport protein